MHTSLIELSDVTVRIGTATIARNADFVVGNGEAIGLFGPNGAGKTTLLRVLATLRRPASGTATVLGADVATSHRFAVRHKIALVGHTPALYPELSLAENTRFAADISGQDADRVYEVLAAVGLAGAADRRAGRTSHGMQRRAEFARVLLQQPRLLLLDEPYNTLDEDAAALVAMVVERTVASGGAAVLVSHDRERVGPLIGRSVELKSGRLV